MSNKKWECEIIAPPELHKQIQELFDAISWKLKHAESSSAQFATDINVGDTVSRQAAIKAFDDAGFCTHGYIVDVLKGLPSASCQQVTDKLDLIDRQAAIDAISAVSPVDPNKSEYASGIACGAALALTYIKQLPSAQPELIKKTAYIRGFEQGRMQGMIDAQGGKK